MVLIVGDQGRRLIGANPCVSKWLGYGIKELRAAGGTAVFADAHAAQELFRTVWAESREVTARISCLHKSGRVIPAMIRAHLLRETGNQLALVVLHPEISEDGVSAHERRRTLSKLLRFACAAESPPAATVQQHVHLWLRRICRTAQFPVAHFQILAEQGTEYPGFVHEWHIGSGKGLDSARRNPFCIALPAEFHARVAAARVPQVDSELTTYPQFQKPNIRDLHLKAAVAVPVMIGNDVGGVTVFYSAEAVPQDSLLVDVIHVLARELGHAIHFRSLSLRLTKLQEEERRRLASELHDTVAQSLSLVRLELETVQQESFALGEVGRTALARGIALAEESLQEIRTLSYLLHPPVLDALGLLPGLRLFIDGFSRRSGLRIISELPHSLPRLPREWETAAFRVVQEGLTNVRRHSRSNFAEVRVNSAGGVVTLQVINEGASAPDLESGGLPPERFGVGLTGMRERVRAFGGDVSLYSRDDKTILEAFVPLPKTSRSPQLPLRF